MAKTKMTNITLFFAGLCLIILSSALNSCSTMLSAVPVDKLPEPARSMIIDARKDRAALLEQYAVGSATMLEAYAVIMRALKVEDLALELKAGAATIRQESSDGSEAILVLSKKLTAKFLKELAKSNHQGKLAQSDYNKHLALSKSARQRQYNLLLTRAIPEMAVLLKASKDASTIEKVALVAEGDRYLTVITDFKKIDKVEEAVDMKAKKFNLEVKKRKNYPTDKAVKKAIPSGAGLAGMSF